MRRWTRRCATRARSSACCVRCFSSSLHRWGPVAQPTPCPDAFGWFRRCPTCDLHGSRATVRCRHPTCPAWDPSSFPHQKPRHPAACAASPPAAGRRREITAPSTSIRASRAAGRWERARKVTERLPTDAASWNPSRKPRRGARTAHPFGSWSTSNTRLKRFVHVSPPEQAACERSDDCCGVQQLSSTSFSPLGPPPCAAAPLPLTTGAADSITAYLRVRGECPRRNPPPPTPQAPSVASPPLPTRQAAVSPITTTAGSRPAPPHQPSPTAAAAAPAAPAAAASPSTPTAAPSPATPSGVPSSIHPEDAPAAAAPQPDLLPASVSEEAATPAPAAAAPLHPAAFPGAIIRACNVRFVNLETRRCMAARSLPTPVRLPRTQRNAVGGNSRPSTGAGARFRQGVTRPEAAPHPVRIRVSEQPGGAGPRH